MSRNEQLFVWFLTGLITNSFPVTMLLDAAANIVAVESGTTVPMNPSRLDPSSKLFSPPTFFPAPRTGTKEE